MKHRIFKFRAWDKINKKMWTEETSSDGTYWNINSDGTLDVTENNICRDSEDFELMQSIGIKDKNGKEIFEGDIIKQTKNYAGETDGKTDFNKKVEKNYFYIVKYGAENCSCCHKVYGFYFERCNKTEFDMSDLDNLEVIGNIWEGE